MTPAPETVDFAVSDGLVDYAAALAVMEARARAIREQAAPELVWFLEHPALYTAGTSARSADLKDPGRFPVFEAGRGGQYTYHGPGQRVVYVMMDLTRRGKDVRAFVTSLEAWIIAALAEFNVEGAVRCGRVGVWIDRTEAGGPLREDKIAAIGVRLKRWVSLHGLALNVSPELSHFEGITPCGIADPRYGVTSLEALGRTASLIDADMALRETFSGVFGSSLRVVPAPL
jgi:lipoyl(octanoyl) transferase